jgi:2-polyprenyl-3-methyl-5-hydroxy-6-metoxy-1,4-benzoquinol methylase
VTQPTKPSVTDSPRAVDPAAFDAAYREVILGNGFVEVPAYYHQHRPRYRNTLRRICNVPLRRPARVLEIGGGQIALLMARLFGDDCTVADLSPEFSHTVTRFGLGHVIYDVAHDDPLQAVGEKRFDLIVMCEVIEHMAVPPYLVLQRLRRIIAPGGWIFLTTPNLYRFRNVVRLAAGRNVFNYWFMPERGQGIGHPVEYSTDHLAFHLEKAGFDRVTTELHQLVNAGASKATHLARLMSTPFLLARPLWRDNLVAYAHNPGGDA